MYDVQKIRAGFPILSREVNGKPLVYLDNGASAQKPRVVIDAVTRGYAEEYANVHRGLHFLSNLATEKYEGVRAKIARFVGAPSEDSIILNSGTTEGINMVAYGWAMPRMQAGDEIILSIMEHHANIVPWHFLRERQGVVIKWVDVAEDGSFDLELFAATLSDKTKVVSITHMSNVTGTVVPIKQVCEIAHARGIPVVVDGSQGAVHELVDVQDLDVDFYIMTGHKLYGPTGIGVLYGKADLLAQMQPYQGGGEMISDVTLEDVTYNEPPHRFEAGTPPIVQAIGLGAALDYISALGRENIKAHEAEVGAYAREKLSKINSLRLIGDAPGKGAIFSFAIEGVHAHDLSTILDRYGIAIRAGSHCAQPLLQRFGVTSTCRASFGVYNGKDDVDALVQGIEKAQKFFA